MEQSPSRKAQLVKKVHAFYGNRTFIIVFKDPAHLLEYFFILIDSLDDRGSRVRFPAGVGNFSLHHRVQNGTGALPASYPMGTRGSFPGGIAAGARS
jgi:hypothetical protein